MRYNIFDFMYEPITFDKNKPIKLFEAFAGIGTQHMALKRLGIDVELVGISEIDKYAISSYEAIHGKVKNYGGIGSFDKLPAGVDIATWSFPCQDISLAGSQKGMGSETRSNYGYVFLDTIENMDYKDRPKVLLMENVKALLSKKFRDDWRNIQLRLENMGYKNYVDSLIATDYGVPQTRDRVFMVSVKGEFSYAFPKPIPLVKKLKDYLEDVVDEKYYLSDKQIEQIVNWKAYNKLLKNAKSNTSMNSNKIQTIKTSPNDIGVVVKDTKNYIEHESLGSIDNTRRAWKEDKVIGTITTQKDSSKVLLNNPLRIRKLTPLESWRLMGIKDEDFHKAKSSGMSDTQLYKQAGNAIVVDVLVAIFKELFKGGVRK